MITQLDLKVLFHKETGFTISDNDLKARNNRSRMYYKWVEEKLLEKMNEEKQIENLFVNEK